MDFDDPVSACMLSPPWRPAVNFDLQPGHQWGQCTFRLIKPFIWYHGNNICRNDQTDERSGWTAWKHNAFHSYRVLTNLAKWNSLSFSGFPDPLNSFFHTIITSKPDVTNHLTSHFGTFLALMQNYRIHFKEHGDRLHPRQSMCHTTNLCSACCGFQIVSPKHTIWFSKISRVYSKFPRVFQN